MGKNKHGKHGGTITETPVDVVDTVDTVDTVDAAPVPPVPTWMRVYADGSDVNTEPFDAWVDAAWAALPPATRDAFTALTVPPSVVAHGWVTPDATEPPMPNNPHTSRYDGRGVYEFQNRLYDANGAGFRCIDGDGNIVTRHLTDYEIAIAWSMAFPRSRCNFMVHVDYVASTRNDYVRGRHPVGDAPNDPASVNRTFGIDGTTVVGRAYRGPAPKPATA